MSRPREAAEQVARAPRARMTGAQRRLQLIEVARGLFAERGFEGTSIEEIAQRAGVSKPIVYEHFGGKEGLYAVVVDREMETLLEMVTSSLSNNRSLYRIQQVALALLTYMEERPDGFAILVRGESTGEGVDGHTRYGSLLNDAISQVEHILAGDFERRGFDPSLAPLYAQALVGMVSVTAQWWLDVREPSKEVVAAHLVNLCWNGLTGLDAEPVLVGPDNQPPAATPEAVPTDASSEAPSGESSVAPGSSA
ncbi:putative TetR family transcriptional regulator [Gordonia hirsuta DSM 44140 = NBRC 16056]|uniref:Putative TetR family transcriptional regulator n=1 Tax=Gordonia hirsuta DSM 44140 = NBRC 16056 TaxID=1121927 RepID=L7LB98_9ACTN|nr:putative TetR family transcriptional regulator [Gordonia hirsuta DSM 44140 = NBRC 16056]